MKLNKSLVARIIVSVHAQKGQAIRLRSTLCQLNNDILLQINYDNHLFRFLEEDDTDKALIELPDELVVRHFGK